jgi:DNA-binding response OmpR family regulator
MAYRILIIEDDFSLAQVMAEQLESWGHQVCLARDFQDVIPTFVRWDPALVLVDIMLPFYNGYHWCREIRRISPVPIVFLSSASDNMNIVMAMNLGADDFIAKPVDPMVMNAKIQAILRRTYDLAGMVPMIEHQGVILNLNDGTVSFGEQQAELTKNEFRILRVLMENKGKVVSRDQLMIQLWQEDCYVEENTLTVNVTRLRKTLESIGITDFIQTKVGSGYCIGTAERIAR